MRIIAMNEYTGTQYKCELLAEFDVPTVTDECGTDYTLAQSGVTYTPDDEPIVIVNTEDGIGYLFVENIRVIKEEATDDEVRM